MDGYMEGREEKRKSEGGREGEEEEGGRMTFCITVPDLRQAFIILKCLSRRSRVVSDVYRQSKQKESGTQQ
jgi:hypothetical protein